MEGNNVAVLLSGGVDSSVVVHLLCERGLRPHLFYILIGIEGDGYSECSKEEDMEICQSVARHYGLSLDVVDLHTEYREQVIGYVIDRARRGLTPNPDVMCNRLIKFGCFEQRVGHEFDYTATGHYATTYVDECGQTWLGTAIDPVKDQTDFLAGIDRLQVAHLRFPLGRLMKSEVRRIATEAGLLSANRRDSQGICFLGQVDYNDFIRHFLGEQSGPVVEVETGRTVGRHHGHWFHTIGQRKGLGLGGGPWFVVRKDVEQNIVYVSHGWETEKQYGRSFHMQGFHFITADPWPTTDGTPIDISFKIRHTPEFTAGRLTRTGGVYHIESAERLQGIAPGQFGVVYTPDHRLCIGSGEISL